MGPKVADPLKNGAQKQLNNFKAGSEEVNMGVESSIIIIDIA